MRRVEQLVSERLRALEQLVPGAMRRVEQLVPRRVRPVERLVLAGSLWRRAGLGPRLGRSGLARAERLRLLQGGSWLGRWRRIWSGLRPLRQRQLGERSRRAQARS